MNNLKRLISLVLVFATALSYIPTAAAAEEAVPARIYRDVETVVPDVDLPDNNVLFESYAERVLYDSFTAAFGTAAREKLTAIEQGIYDRLKTNIEDIAANGGYTRFYVSDLSGISGLELVVPTYSDFFSQFNMRKIVIALLSDCPYDLYWFDKTVGYSYGAGYYEASGGTVIEDLYVTFYVAEAYMEDSSKFHVTSGVSAVRAAKTNAQAIVSSVSGSSVYNQLVTFRDAICQRVSYDDHTAENIYTPYGDPWQLIYVFDGDASTNVVCEGYSKAFQYLCDLSGITCYSVTGEAGRRHMWNIVTLDGSRYLADITNSDAGTIGQDGGLFLAGNSGGSATGGYTFDIGGTSVTYTYDADTLSLWSTGDLTLAASDYDPGPAGITVGTPAVTVTADTGNSLNITWTAVPGASYYQLCRSTSADGAYTLVGIYHSTTLSKIDRALTAGKTYYYKVRAYAVQDGERIYGSYSDAVGAAVKPAVPTVTVTPNTYTSLKISWSKVTGASYYQVYRSAGADGTYTLLGIYTNTTFSKIDSGLSLGTKYYYKVRAYTLAGDARVMGDYGAAAATVRPPAPTGVQAVTGSSSGTVDVSWNAASGASFYQVYRSATGTGNWTLMGVYDANTTGRTNKSLTSGNTYYYKVRCYRLVSGNRYFSDYSAIVSAKAK